MVGRMGGGVSTLRNLGALLCAVQLSLGALFAAQAAAQVEEYPAKPVRIIVPWPQAEPATPWRACSRKP